MSPSSVIRRINIYSRSSWRMPFYIAVLYVILAALFDLVRHH